MSEEERLPENDDDKLAPGEATPEPAREVSNDAEIERTIRRMSRRGFLMGAAGAAAGLGGYYWLNSRTPVDGISGPLRTALGADDKLAELYFRPRRLAQTFSEAQVQPLRLNGDVGLGPDFNPKHWMLHVMGSALPGAVVVSLDAIKRLPRHEMIAEMKCIEGWSNIVHYAGARLSDFVAAYPPATRSGAALDIEGNPGDLPRYMSITTPDLQYFVGLDMASALHPQTLLCYEMNGAPLAPEHGAPLRLAIPVKYGIKNIKRIGNIVYTDSKPADYWAMQGYDWYAGH